MKGMLLKIPLFIQSTILSFSTRRLIFFSRHFPRLRLTTVQSHPYGKVVSDVRSPHLISHQNTLAAEEKREKQNHICFVDRKAEDKISPGHARTSSPFAMLGNDQFIVAIRSSIHPSIHTRAPCEFIHTRSGSAYTPFFCRSEKAAVLVGDNKALSLLRVYACLLW